MTTYRLYDDANRPMETFAGPFRLARMNALPEGWSIERFLGTVSQGMVSLADVQQHAADATQEAAALVGKAEGWTPERVQAAAHGNVDCGTAAADVVVAAERQRRLGITSVYGTRKVQQQITAMACLRLAQFQPQGLTLAGWTPQDELVFTAPWEIWAEASEVAEQLGAELGWTIAVV